MDPFVKVNAAPYLKQVVQYHTLAHTVTSFKSRLKTFLFDSLKVRAESGLPGPTPRDAALGL